MPYRSSSRDSRHEAVEAEWWRAKELHKEPHEILDTLVRQIEEDQETRYQAYREYARLFGAEPDLFGSEHAFSVLREEFVSQNELANTIETLHAQVFKNRVVPAVSVSEADWEEWQRAKGYSRWLEGIFDKAEVYYDPMPRAGLDMFVYGTGFIKIGHIEDKNGVTITFHRVDPRKMLVDRLEARNGKPRSLYEKDYMDMYLLADIYGQEDDSYHGTADERVTGILSCVANDDLDMAIGQRVKTQMVTVREAWHLPSYPGAKNGRHVIWVKGCTLVDEPWNWDRWPFTILRHGHRIDGFYGESAVKRLAPTQKQLDKLNRKIDEAQDIMGIPRIILSKGAHLERTHLDDIPGGVLEVDGNVDNAIKDWNATAMAPEIYNERASAPEKMRSLLGVTSFDTQNALPNSMREVSGPALERLVDRGTARHALIHAELEHAICDLALLAMDYAADLEKRGKDIIVSAPGSRKSAMEMVNFKDVKVDRNKMRLRVQPISQMPQTISGKIDAFSKLRENNDIDRATYLKMLEIPDTESTTDFLGSDEEIILKNLYFITKKKKYLPPLEYDNLKLIPPLATAFINHYRLRDDADMEVVEMLGQYIEAAVLLDKGLGGTDENAPPPVVDPMAAQAAALGAPMDPSMAPPVGQELGMGAPPMGGPAPMDPGAMPQDPMGAPLPMVPGIPPMM